MMQAGGGAWRERQVPGKPPIRNLQAADLGRFAQRFNRRTVD
jgi:hypothetical protein